jgi:hypothetical protein
MTPREHDTLATILRHVGAFNNRVANGAQLERVLLTQRGGQVVGGDLLITSVEFRPTGAKCA